MMEVFGFIVLCGLNAFFSVGVLAFFSVGGLDLSPLFSTKGRYGEKVWCLFLMLTNGLFWYLLYANSPIGIVVN